MKRLGRAVVVLWGGLLLLTACGEPQECYGGPGGLLIWDDHPPADEHVPFSSLEVGIHTDDGTATAGSGGVVQSESGKFHLAERIQVDSPGRCYFNGTIQFIMATEEAGFEPIEVGISVGDEAWTTRSDVTLWNGWVVYLMWDEWRS